MKPESTIESLIRAIVREELATHAAPPTHDLVYTTAPGGPLPAGRSRRWLRDHARRIPGATRSGGARGRSVVWIVSHADYARWLAGQTTSTVKPSAAQPTPTPAKVVDIDAFLRAAGLRATTRSA